MNLNAHRQQPGRSALAAVMGAVSVRANQGVKVSQRRLAFLAARGPLRPPGALLRRRTLATRRRAVSKVRLWAWWAVMRLRGAQPWQARNAMLAHMHAAQSRKSCP
jgi:hypothetical protein